jgi:hypothetical protein
MWSVHGASDLKRFSSCWFEALREEQLRVPEHVTSTAAKHPQPAARGTQLVHLQKYIFLNKNDEPCPAPSDPAPCAACKHSWLAKVYQFGEARKPWKRYKCQRTLYKKARASHTPSHALCRLALWYRKQGPQGCSHNSKWSACQRRRIPAMCPCRALLVLQALRVPSLCPS